MVETKQMRWTGSYEDSGGAALVTTYYKSQWMCITYIFSGLCEHVEYLLNYPISRFWQVRINF